MTLNQAAELFKMSDDVSSQDLEPFLNNISGGGELPLLRNWPETNMGFDSQEILNEHLKYEESRSSELSMENSPTGHNPSVIDFPGPFLFCAEPDNSRTDKAWLFSQELKKVFINVDKVLVMRFGMNTFFPGMFVRALPVYSSCDFSHEPVNRCPTHSQKDDPDFKAHAEDGLCLCNQYNLVGHVLRSHAQGALYQFDGASRRHSVVVPMLTPQCGDTHITVPFSFACKTSCASGMQRRPILIVFTLENEGQEVFGRQVMAVKICACPKRDMERLEKDQMESQCGKRDDTLQRRESTKRSAKCLISNSIHTLTSLSKRIKLIPAAQSTDTDNSDHEAETAKKDVDAALQQVVTLFYQLSRIRKKLNKKST